MPEESNFWNSKKLGLETPNKNSYWGKSLIFTSLHFPQLHHTYANSNSHSKSEIKLGESVWNCKSSKPRGEKAFSNSCWIQLVGNFLRFLSLCYTCPGNSGGLLQIDCSTCTLLYILPFKSFILSTKSVVAKLSGSADWWWQSGGCVYVRGWFHAQTPT